MCAETIKAVFERDINWWLWNAYHQFFMYIYSPMTGDGKAGSFRGGGGVFFFYIYVAWLNRTLLRTHVVLGLRRWWERRGRDGGGRTQFVHGRSCMTIYPCIPTMPRRSTSGFHQPGQTLLAPSAKRREVFGESHEGWTSSFQEPLVRRTSAPCAHFLAYGWQRQWVDRGGGGGSTRTSRLYQ